VSRINSASFTRHPGGSAGGKCFPSRYLGAGGSRTSSGMPASFLHGSLRVPEAMKMGVRISHSAAVLPCAAPPSLYPHRSVALALFRRQGLPSPVPWWVSDQGVPTN